MCKGEAKFTAIMLRYVILLNIHKGIRAVVLWPQLLTLFPWQGIRPAVLQLFPVDIYKCTNASELVSLSRSPCGLQKLWTTPVHVHIALATEVIQLPHSRQQACFINVEVWLVTLTDENALTSNRPCNIWPHSWWVTAWWQHVQNKLHCQHVRWWYTNSVYLRPGSA